MTPDPGRVLAISLCAKDYPDPNAPPTRAGPCPLRSCRDGRVQCPRSRREDDRPPRCAVCGSAFPQQHTCGGAPS
jgi:hypothetical protein